MGVAKQFTDEEKRAAVSRMLSEDTAAVAAELGVSTTALYQWRKKLRDTPRAETSAKPPKKRASAKKAKPKKKAQRRAKAEAEPEAAERDALAVIDDWSLPYTLGAIVEAAYVLRDADDYEALERLERAVGSHRQVMDRRAA